MSDLVQLTMDGGREWIVSEGRAPEQRSLEEIGALAMAGQQPAGQARLLDATAPAARSCEQCRSGNRVGTLVSRCSLRGCEVYNITACDCGDYAEDDR